MPPMENRVMCILIQRRLPFIIYQCEECCTSDARFIAHKTVCDVIHLPEEEQKAIRRELKW
jgi:hypothetical protein